MKVHYARFILALIAGLFASGFSSEQHLPLQLDGLSAIKQIGSSARTLADSAGKMTIAEARQALSAGSFKAVSGPHFDAGYSITPHWISIPLQNVSDTNATYLLATNIPYIIELSFQLLRESGATETLLDKRETSPWKAKEFQGQSVVSNQFVLAPGEIATVFARFQPYGIGVLPLSIETPDSVLKKVATNTTTLYVFYSFAITKLLVLLLFVLAVKPTGGLKILVFFLSGLLLMAQLDGLLNQWLWPHSPLWNKVASFPMLLALCATGLMTATFMLRTGGAPLLARISQYLTALCFIPLLLIPVTEVAWLILVGFGLLVVSMGLTAYAVINWAQLLPGKSRVALVIGIGVFLFIAFTIGIAISGQSDLSAQNLIIAKVQYGLITLIITMSYATHVAALNREYSKSVVRQLKLTQKEARISADLLQSERRYYHAKALLSKQQNKLANASHDLRQPISSLRHTLASIRRKDNGTVDENITRAFDYLDDLASNLSTETQHDEQPESDSQLEAIPVSLITETVTEMFSEEAQAKGLELAHIPRDYTVLVPPIAVMRITSNLVANAVRHTESGRVSVSSKRSQGQVAIEITDTGPGMDPHQLKTLSARYEKGSSSQGLGLGLSICHELADQNNLILNVRSEPRKGTRFSLIVPSDEV